MWEQFCDTVLREAAYDFENIVNDRPIEISIDDDAYELLRFYVKNVSDPFFFYERLRFIVPSPPLIESLNEMESITHTAALFSNHITDDCTKYFASVAGCTFALAIEGHKSLRSLRYVDENNFVLPKTCDPPSAAVGFNVERRSDGTWIATKDIRFFDPIVQSGDGDYNPIQIDNKKFETEYVTYATERYLAHFLGPPRRHLQNTNDDEVHEQFESIIKGNTNALQTVLSSEEVDDLTKAKIQCLTFENRKRFDDTDLKKIILRPVFSNAVCDITKLPEGLKIRQQKIASIINGVVINAANAMWQRTETIAQEGNILNKGKRVGGGTYEMRQNTRLAPTTAQNVIAPRKQNQNLTKMNTYANKNIKKEISKYIKKEVGESLCDCDTDETNYKLNIICKNPTDSCKNPFATEKKTEIFSSVDKGLGLKAAELIKKDDFIIEYVGEIIDEAEYEKRDKKIKAGKLHGGMPYFFQLKVNKKKIYIDAGDKNKSNNARYINSSCEPNAVQEIWTDAATRSYRVGLFAKRDILEGEELTFLYDKDKKFFTKDKPCVCGAANCQSKKMLRNTGLDVNTGFRCELHKTMDFPFEILQLNGMSITTLDQMDEYLSRCGLRRGEAHDDGNCFFYSVTELLHDDAMARDENGKPFHKIYREQAFRTMMRLARERREPPEKREAKMQALELLQRDKEWATTELVEGLAVYLNVIFQIFVLQQGGRNESHSTYLPMLPEARNLRVIPLVNISDLHFEPVYPLLNL